MNRLAAIGVAWLATAAVFAAVPAGSPVLVRLRPVVVLAAPSATLGDLAELSGPPAAVAALAPIFVQPLRSTPVLVDEFLVRARIARQAPAIAVVISGETRVSQPLRTISVEEQVRAATAVLVRPGDDAEVTLQRASGPLTVADDGRSPRLEATPLDRGRVGEVALRVRLLAGEDELARALVVLRVRRYVQVVVLAAAVRRGAALGAGDLSRQRSELSPATQDAILDPEQVLGFEATRDLSPGQILTPALAVAPLAVRPGQGITLVWRTGTVELSALGQALAGGHDGDIIAVKREVDQQRARGQVIGPGRVLMNF